MSMIKSNKQLKTLLPYFEEWLEQEERISEIQTIKEM